MPMLQIQTPLLCQNELTNYASQTVCKYEANVLELFSSGDANFPAPFAGNEAGPPVIQALCLQDGYPPAVSALVGSRDMMKLGVRDLQLPWHVIPLPKHVLKDAHDQLILCDHLLPDRHCTCVPVATKVRKAIVSVLDLRIIISLQRKLCL